MSNDDLEEPSCSDPLFAPAGESKRPKRYFPFAEGPRSCVGQSLAKVSLVATMATLLQHFHFELADEVSHHQIPPLRSAEISTSSTTIIVRMYGKAHLFPTSRQAIYTRSGTLSGSWNGSYEVARFGIGGLSLFT